MPTYEVTAPDGNRYRVTAPEGATQDQIIQYVQSQVGRQAITAPPAPQPEQSGVLRQILDVPLQVVRGGVGGIRMLADLFGAGSSASEALKSADTWLADLLSSQAKNDQRRIAEILKEAEDKGVLAQVGAGLRALATAPVDTLAQALGSTAPVIIAGLASGPVGAALGVARAGAVAMPAVGAAMGVGEVKGSIYEAVEQAYKKKGASDEIARAKALEAQAYASSNFPSMVAAGGLGAIAGGMGIERPLASMLSRGAVKDVAEQQALRDAERGLLPRVGLGALREGAPEFAQAGQSQLAQNIALRSEGFDVPLFRNVFGAGAMEGAAGAILGGGLAVPRTGVERLPGQQEGESDAAFARRMSREIDAARRAEQPLAPVTQPVAPTEPVVSTAPEGEDVFRLPDGSVGTLDQVRAYAMNLPPEQRASTLQSILAQRVPREKTVPPDLFTQPAEKPAEQAAEGAAPTKPVVAEKPAEEAKPEVVEPVKPPAVAMTKEEEEVAADAAKGKPEQSFVTGYEPVEVPLDQLKLSKEVPQFKADADQEGIVERLEGKFDRINTAPIQVWRRLDGSLEVISGRHRFDLAKRSGEKTIPAQIHDEATGFDADQASILDATLNIRDQQGKGRDYVAYFRKSGISEEDASARGLLGRAPGKPAFAIAKNGSEELVGAHRADIVSDAGAAAIANAAPGDSRLQAVGIKAIQEGKSPLAAVNIIKAVQEISKGRPAPEGGDLFGFDDSAMKEAEEMAKIATLKQNQIAQRLAAISGASRRPEIAKKEGIDIKDPDALKKREKELRQQRAAWDNWSSSSELVQEIRKEMAPAEKPEEKPSVREAEPKKLPKDVEAKIDALGKALQRILTRYGLKDVGLRLVADMKAEGEYASRVLSLALDATDPVVALRHEAIHAMKELGFFSPAQWNSLERQAKEKWVDQYLKQKNVNRQPLQPGQISRYDAYMKFYGGDQEAILEEAIADAFADFSATKAPPGMLQALLKKIQNFFQGIKEAFGAEPDAERIFKKVERGELRPGQVPQVNGQSERLSLSLPNDYRGEHRAPTKENGAPAHDLKDVYPDDVYGLNGPRYYGHYGDANDLESFEVIRRVRNLPNVPLTIYRAVPKSVPNEINNGDWVTISKKYAKLHGESVLNGDYKIIKKLVHPRDIFTNGDSIHEWGYDPQPRIQGEEAKEKGYKPSLRVVEGKEKPDLGKNVTVDTVGKYFDDQVVQQFGGKLNYNNPEHFNRAVQQAIDEVKYQIKQKNSGLDWYEEDVQKAFKNTIKVLPQLKKEDNRILFSVMAGIMSPETNARDNWFIAAKAFEHYVNTGDIPGVNPENGNLWMGGTQSANKKIQLEFLDRMVKDLGVKKAVRWLLSPQLVKDINQYRAKYGLLKSGVGGKAMDLKPNGLFAFGEKIGPFISNLNGIHDVTVDKWFTRTFNRYFGTMIGPDGKIVNAPTEPQRRVVKELANRVAKDAGIKNYQVQSLLWFYEQRLFTQLGAQSPSYGFSDGSKKFLDARGKGAVPAGAVPAEQAGTGRAKPSLRDKLGLYSELESKVSQGPGKGTAEAWKGYINGLTQKGVKPEEIEWSGVRDWLDLQKGSVTKEDLLAYLKQGGVQVEEVVLGGKKDLNALSDAELRKEYVMVRGYEPEAYGEPMSREEIIDELQNAIAEDRDTTKYSKHTLPGGENYREVLLTLPSRVDEKTQRLLDEERYLVLSAEEQAKVDAAKKKAGVAYRSTHWDQPNVLAHIRVNDRTDADGNKVLFVEEIQSDWGQEGKKRGFGAKLKDGYSIVEQEPGFFHLRQAGRQYPIAFGTRANVEQEGRAKGAFESGPPVAPFVATRKFAVFKGGKEFTRTDKEGKEVKQRYDSMEAAEAAAKKVDGEARDLGLQANTEGWLNLALKRIMVMAGEGGYDKVAFVNGDQSAERYDLSKQVGRIDWSGQRDGAKSVSISPVNGNDIEFRVLPDGTTASMSGGLSGNEFTGRRLDEVIGKELADKVMAERDGSLSGLDLKVGGEGMKTFYNTIVPTAVKKLLPKVGGGQMGEVEFGSVDGDRYWVRDVGDEWVVTDSQVDDGSADVSVHDTEQAATAEANRLNRADAGNMAQPGFDVTPAMKERVRTTGLPRFSLRDTVNVDGTERPTTSSTNKPIYPTEEGTKNFWRWFKDSAVVDDDGRPLVVYRGVDADYGTTARVSKEGALGAGIYTTPSASFASYYAEGESPNVMPLYVSLQKPLLLKHKGNEDPMIMALVQLGMKQDKAEAMVEKAYEEKGYIGKQVMNRALSQGYDGLMQYRDGKLTEIVAFNPTQIKSAIGNVGKFDPVDPSIKASLRDVIDPAIRARIDQTTTPREEKTFIKRITEAIAPKSASSFRAAFLDRYNRLSEYDKELTRQMGGAPLLADASSHSAALMSDLSAGVLAGAMGVHDGVGGIPVYVNGYTKIVNNNNTVKGPIAIFAPLAKLGDPTAYQAYQFWAGVKRGTRFDREGREQLFEKADLQKADDLRKQFLAMGVDFEAIQKEWIKFNDGLVQYLKDTGVLSDAAAKEFVKYSDYIPFYRQADGEETVGPQIFASLSGVRAPKKLKGSETPIAEFLETVVRNVQYSIEAGMKNVAAQRAVNTAVAIGQANRLNYVSSAPNVVKVLENGKTSYYETKDLLFVEAMKSLNLGDLPFIGLLAGPANLLRNLVTKDPAFMLANMMRDSMSAWVSSGVKMTPFVDTLTNFTKALRNQNPEYSALLFSGAIGGYDYSQGVEISARRFERALRKEAGVYTPAEKLARPFTSLWDALEKGTTASDAATRMEVYKKTLAETGNEAEALFRAVEVMNFNRKGNNPLVRVLTAAVPFLNARMQGLDVLYRAAFGRGTEANAKDIQKSFFIRGMTIAALSTMYWMLASEDDEWKRQEQETRDNYWILGDVKIPIPFEIGVLFKVIPERILEYSFGDDTGKDFLKSMTRQLTSTLSFNPIPQTALPLIESVTNYSFFTGRPIVSQGLEDVNPAYQIAPGTSRIGELIGGATKDLPTALQLSPVKIDEMIRGYTGTIGGYMMDLFDAIYDMNTDAPKAVKRFEQMPVIRRFAVDPLARGQVTAYYELKNSVDEAVRTANLLERNMKPQEWGEFMQENMGLLATKDYVLDLEKSMKQYREMKNFVRASTMSAGEKKDIIANITELENNLASNIQEIKKMIDAQ